MTTRDDARVPALGLGTDHEVRQPSRRVVSAAAVAFVLREHSHDSATTVCTLPAYWRQVTTTLPAPLAGRVLVDASSSAAVAITKAVPRS